MDEYIPKTELEKIVMEYYKIGDNNFNWYQLSTSSSITIEFILHHMDYPWRWSLISQHIYIPEYDQLVDRHIDKYRKWIENGFTIP